MTRSIATTPRFPGPAVARAGSGVGLLWLVLLGIGCGGAPAKPAAKLPAGTTTPKAMASGMPEVPFLHASATGPSEADAYAEALARLEQAVYGEETWARDLAVPLHDPAVDPMERADTADGRTQVTVGVERDRLEGFLTQLAEQPWQAAGPAPLAADMAHLYQLHRERFVCERRQALLDEACTLPSDEEMAAPLDVLVREVQIRPFFPDGVPVDAEGRPLRPLEVVAERVTSSGRRVPLVGLPVIAVQPDGADALMSTETVSDDAGVARFAFASGAAWPGEVRVALDWRGLLGTLGAAGTWPAMDLPVTSRDTGVRRWSLMATERVQGQPVSDGVFARSLDQVMRDQGAMPKAALDAQALGGLRLASPSERADSLPAMADTLEGRVDVLVVAEIDSEYASRMSTHHVWYEARGRADVFDLWTGQHLATLEATATASGVGDERAARAARTQLAQDLAGQLMKVQPVRLEP